MNELLNNHPRFSFIPRCLLGTVLSGLRVRWCLSAKYGRLLRVSILIECKFRSGLPAACCCRGHPIISII